MLKQLQFIVGIWIFLFALFLPFNYYFLPHPGDELTLLFSSITKQIALLLGLNPISVPTTSDSIILFIQSGTLLLVSALINVIWNLQRRISIEQSISFLRIISTYILSFFLLKYGCDKLFQYQFYAPEPNTMFTPVGYLSKDILFWSSMGTSSAYNTFMGLFEIIPGLLLLHQRTRLLGGLIALGALINVLAINFSFDITVKLLSMYLVIVSLYVISPWIKPMMGFFLQMKQHQEKMNPEEIQLRPVVKRVVKGLVICLLLIEIVLPYAQNTGFNGRNVPKIQHYGSYEVISESDTFLNQTDLRRVHIHSRGYLILEDKSGEFTDYPIRISPAGAIILVKSSEKINVISKKDATEFVLGNARLTLQKIDLDALPANDDSFHWTVDGMISE